MHGRHALIQNLGVEGADVYKIVHRFCFLHAQHAYGWPSEPPFHDILPSENDTMCNQPKEDTNFGSMLKGPYFVTNFPRGEEIEIFLDDIGLFYVERTP